MSKPRWLVVNKKSLILLFILILGFWALYRGGNAIFSGTYVPPEERLASALDNVIYSNSFRFKMLVKVGDAVISNVEGERTLPDSVHITGTMQDLPVEFIHTGNKTYIKGFWSDNWTTLESNQMAVSELFVTELNPLSMFIFKDIPQVKEVKSEVINGTKMVVLDFNPIVQNSLMELNYDNFSYRVWVNPKSQVINKANILATGSVGKRDQLEITLEFWDFNKQISIVVPNT